MHNEKGGLGTVSAASKAARLHSLPLRKLAQPTHLLTLRVCGSAVEPVIFVFGRAAGLGTGPLECGRPCPALGARGESPAPGGKTPEWR